MYFFYPNRTLIYNDNLTNIFTSLMCLVIILTIFGMLLVILEITVRISFKSISIGYHINLSIIFMNLAFFYLLFSPSIIVIIFEIFDWSNTDSIENSTTFHVANIFRSLYIFVGAFSLPAIGVERMFATIFVEDYEIKRRCYIGICLAVIVNGCSLVAMFCFIYDFCSMFIILTIIAMANIAALIIFLYNAKCNLSFYQDNLCHGSCIRYSLSQRFQVVENIKVASMIKKLFIFGWICTTILVCLFSISLLLVAIYAIAIQGIHISENQVVQKELKKVIQKLNLPFLSYKVEPAGHQIRSVFGVEIIGEAEDETKKHFNQLAKSWNI